MRLACLLEYEGTDFHGFQSQEALPTIQGEIQQAFKSISINLDSFNYSGRTDAGVHALSQVFDFETSVQRGKEEWLNGLNSNLPRSIHIKDIIEVEDNFHSRYSAKERHYSYLIYNGKSKPTFFENFVHWDNSSLLDIDKMNTSAQELIGEHDFSSFRSSHCGSKNPIKTINKISITQHESFLILNISANAFLHNMVRIIAGTLIDISKDELKIGMNKLIEEKDRRHAGKTLPAKGLFFLGPRYDTKLKINSPFADVLSIFKK